MVQAASVNVAGAHSQWVTNVHLDDWTSERDFHERLYPRYKDTILGQAARFCEQEKADPSKTLVFISAGAWLSHLSQHLRR